MRLSIVTGFFLPVPALRGGSTEKIWHRLATEFARARHEVTFISRRWPGLPDDEIAEGVKHIRLRGWDHTRSLPVNLWHDLRWGFRVARALPPGDVVICNTVTLPVWLKRVKPRAGKVVAVLARMPKGHGRGYGNTDLLLSLSGSVTEAVTRENPAIAKRIAPFPYPIDWHLHASAGAARPPQAPGAPVVVGYIGRIHPEKGVDLLVRAAARLCAVTHLPSWRLVIQGPVRVEQGGAGEGFVDRLRQQANPELKRRLEIRPPEFNVGRLAVNYAEMDVFCYPSVAEHGETFGVAVAEAMAAQAAPVVSNLACFRDFVRNGENGMVFDHRSNQPDIELADCLAHLIGNAATRRRLGAAAQHDVRRYDFAETATSVLATLHALASGE